MSRQYLANLGWLLALCAGGCGDDGGPTAIDARAVDAAIDAALDGGVDASTAFDIPSICARVCHHLLGECAGNDTNEASCRVGCADDLIDCSMQELMTLDACRNVACTPPDNSAVTECLQSVGCVESGGD